MNVPFLDLVNPHVELEKELVAAFRGALRSAGFIGGAAVDGFEREFARFSEAKYCVGVASGTDALRFALMAAGVQPGSSVITVCNTFIATTEAISQVGALPEFVDVDGTTYNMDPEKLREYLEVQCTRNSLGELISRRTGRLVSAIIPVHLYGQMADMDPILELADRHKLIVIEDACQAHGAQYYSRKHQRWFTAGSLGRAAAFSFYPGKNLGACGEAGAVTTNDSGLAAEVRMIRDHGQTIKYFHDIEGYNGRLDAIQAAILTIKLQHVREWNNARRERANEYNRLFQAAACSVVTPFEPSWSRAVYHLYVVQVKDRDELISALKEQNIGTGIHYPVPLHLQKAYDALGYLPGAFPTTEHAAHRIISLPMFPTLTAEQQDNVVARIRTFVESARTPVLSL
jgi:dTDP-4-amino-4,6-dideoxygalactose transaminase